MNKVRTHYDNLKVSRDAPAEVVRAAYKSLAAKYHPDKNENSPESQRAMKIINESYAVLSDPEKRRVHDAWIAEMEAVEVDVSPQEQRFSATTADEEQEPIVPKVKRGGFKIEATFILALFLILIAIVLNQRGSNESQQQVAEQQRQTQPAAPTLDASGVPEGWSVRLGSLSSAVNARSLVERLQARGHRAYSREVRTEQGTVTAVFVGPGVDLEAMQQLQRQLLDEFELSGIVVRYEIEELEDADN